MKPSFHHGGARTHYMTLLNFGRRNITIAFANFAWSHCSKTSFVVCVAICCLIQLSRAFQRWWRRKTRRKEENKNFSAAHFVICPFLRTCVNLLEFVALEGKGSRKSSKRSHIFSDYEFWLTSYSIKLWRGSGFRYYCCPREQRHKNYLYQQVSLFPK